MVETTHVNCTYDVSPAYALFVRWARHTICDLPKDRIGSWKIQDLMNPGSQIPVKLNESYKFPIFVVE